VNLLLINPNSTESMTRKMLAAGQAVLAAGSSLEGVTAAFGPESIEGYYDEVFAIPATLQAIAARPAAQGVIIGCFDDTGVDAARCITAAPVVGICQAAMQAAAVLAGSFSVVTTLGRSVPALEHLTRRYGYGNLCRRIRACEVPVLELEDPRSNAMERIRVEIGHALREDRCEAVVLGCGGMSDLARRLSEEFGMPVIEGVTAAVKLVEGLATIGLGTSRIGGYASPRAKRYAGAFQTFAPR
jgi:allantoin racemase